MCYCIFNNKRRICSSRSIQNRFSYKLSKQLETLGRKLNSTFQRLILLSEFRPWYTNPDFFLKRQIFFYESAFCHTNPLNPFTETAYGSFWNRSPAREWTFWNPSGMRICADGRPGFGNMWFQTYPDSCGQGVSRIYKRQSLL